MESELWPALDDFEDSVDAISQTLKPLLEQNLPKHASMLPLFDKAKLYIITTYALETLLYSYLETSATPTADHPIMKELTRVRQYFQKIRDIESKEPKQEEKAPVASASLSSARVDTRDNLVLDKAAAGRFISAALAGNDKYDLERAENVRLQKEKAKEKLGDLGEGVKDPLGQRAPDSSSDDDEDGGVRLVTGDSEDETGKSASATPAPKTGDASPAGDVDVEGRGIRKESKRKREVDTKEGDDLGKKKKRKDKKKKQKKDKAAKQE
ncbi:hypothetical protein TWF481_008171 [Arthrobotrys musiformis]|uniref:Exosome complex protein n=1 Tax=Arthrobotrys musiformis TaxID=47236 RepID=A0AAV9W7R6_9PEZI